jgi:predicted kinase
MPRLVLINGAPGSGKSTVAQALAQDREMTLALDVDTIKHSLGRWSDDPAASGLRARGLYLALAEEQLGSGFDVVLGQYLAQPPFIEDLEALADRLEVRFVELVLDIDAATLADRLAIRAGNPDRPEHVVNNRLVGPDDASRLVESMEILRLNRPRAIWVDARGSHSSTVDLLRAALTD